MPLIVTMLWGKNLHSLELIMQLRLINPNSSARHSKMVNAVEEYVGVPLEKTDNASDCDSVTGKQTGSVEPAMRLRLPQLLHLTLLNGWFSSAAEIMVAECLG